MERQQRGVPSCREDVPLCTRAYTRTHANTHTLRLLIVCRARGKSNGKGNTEGGCLFMRRECAVVSTRAHTHPQTHTQRYTNTQRDTDTHTDTHVHTATHTHTQRHPHDTRTQRTFPTLRSRAREKIR